MQKDIQYILECAILAPSLHNAQPWRWRSHGAELQLFRVPERDDSLLDSTMPEAQYVALGMALENACIAATACGYRPTVQLFPDDAEPTHAATLSLAPDTGIPIDPLARTIQLRATNRKHYYHLALSTHEELTLEKAGGAQLKMVSDPKSIRQISRAAALHKYLVYANKAEHDSIYAYLNWTLEEDRIRGIGFNLPSLEIDDKAWLLRLLCNWSITRIASLLGMARYTEYLAFRAYNSGAAFGLVTASEATPYAWIEAGRLSERIWLTATMLGLSLQPITNVLYFAAAIDRGETMDFTGSQIHMIRRADARIREAFGVAKETKVAFMFRVGHAPRPSARSSRLSFQSLVSVDGAVSSFSST